MDSKKPISIEEIRQRAAGTIIDIPDWDNPSNTIAIRVKRIDLTTKILESDILPNELRVAADSVFNGSDEEIEDSIKQSMIQEGKFDKFISMLDAMCEEAMLEPKFKEVQEAYPLILTQKIAIFNWLMGGIQKLKSFRGEPAGNDGAVSGS